MRPIAWPLLAIVLAACPAVSIAQPADARALIASQTEAMHVLAMLDGVWRGPASIRQADGSALSFVQTERIGPFLGGSIRVIEGRGYDDAGAVRFNALGIVSYDPTTRAYTMHSHALGHVGDFAFVPTADGYRWEIPLGAAGAIRYVATIRDGELHEVGDRIVEGREPLLVFEMRLKRVGDTDWPAAGAIHPQ
ncbi:MAG TPA: DUF1579 domain-containing protein [Caldimonas sp.]